MDGIVLVKKPRGMTSHDVVNKLRHILKMKKIGHTGTLDPEAEGALLVLLGKCTKLLPYLNTDTKEYVATLRFGATSDTLDIWGELETFVEEMPTKEAFEETLQKFLGPSKQIPPMVSAIKVQGKKLYEYAREGKTIEREPREIVISELELLDWNEGEPKFRCVCSSGTYIRSLCADIAESLGVHGIMSSLVRTKIDSLELKDADLLEEMEEGKMHLLDVMELFKKKYPFVKYTSDKDIMDGKTVHLPTEEEMVFVVNQQEDTILAAYERDHKGWYHCKRGLWG